MDQPLANLITVGHISDTHGIRGQVRLYSYSGNLSSLQAAKELFLKPKTGTTLRQIRLKKASSHSGKILLALEGFDSVNQAQELIGFEVLLDRYQLPSTAEDEYYWHDLLGLSVVTIEGQTLGNIADILETGANDVYLVRNQETRREYLIPAIAHVITKIDLQSGTMLITPLEGLLDL